jgi:hypothetical protein
MAAKEIITKKIKNKIYALYDYYPTLNEAEKKANDLNGRIHILTGKITEATTSKIPATKTSPAKYAVWSRKRD